MSEFVHLKQLLAKALESVQFEQDLNRQNMAQENAQTDYATDELRAMLLAEDEHSALIVKIQQALKP